ncbi:hypothetical protein FEM48_Zijuj09G0210600 [Ziziphus jujuba var. spinosa]|uniref:Fatty acid amide hydrolase-like n=1 Tax=Ziziphus jujuba var. spinosa TaxID=714518 RepID=A0A978UVB1_ZIZJJ|nr:hypothetical protein FEM48_Zijuj09G0210600 [Ziziphus jujuba var. spinosa]
MTTEINLMSYTMLTFDCLTDSLHNVYNVQVGNDNQGLPIGMQLIGSPWPDASILRLASAVEHHDARPHALFSGTNSKKRPVSYFDDLNA